MPMDLSRRTVLGSLAAIGLSPAVGRGSSRNADETLLSLVGAKRAAHDLPGLAAAVVRGGRITALAVSGFRRSGMAEAMERGDRFHIASCTKSMTATLAAIAIRRGRLDWTTSLAEALPELAGSVRSEYRSATLEQLLAHAARMPAYTQPTADRVAWMHALGGTPGEQRLAFLRDTLSSEPPNDSTGDGAYSNVGYVAASAMIERATGISWERAMRSELAEPLGLRSLGFGYPASPSSPNQPRGHARVDGRTETLPFDTARDLAVALRPAGAVHVSIGDLARYARDHLNGLRGRRALLPPGFYARLHSPLPASTSPFTLGRGVRQDEGLGRLHFGAGSGGWFFARIWIAPERDAAVVTAANSGDAAAATRELSNEILG
jgi:CubicO group peptidase (beta-lactamase class C family)